MNNAIITNSTNPELGKYQQLAEKCMKLVKNKLYFKHKALSPAIYRMPINYVDPGIGIFGTDANQVYADPMDVISRYKNSPERLIRSYLHMLFHCIYLHPFQTQLNIDNGVWNIALDICCENAVMRLNPEEQNLFTDLICEKKESIKNNILYFFRYNFAVFLLHLKV